MLFLQQHVCGDASTQVLVWSGREECGMAGNQRPVATTGALWCHTSDRGKEIQGGLWAHVLACLCKQLTAGMLSCPRPRHSRCSMYAVAIFNVIWYKGIYLCLEMYLKKHAVFQYVLVFVFRLDLRGAYYWKYSIFKCEMLKKTWTILSFAIWIILKFYFHQ